MATERVAKKKKKKARRGPQGGLFDLEGVENGREVTVLQPDHPAVPVWIDDIKDLEGFAATRCVYLSLAMDASEGGTPLWLSGFDNNAKPLIQRLNLLVLSLEAVITSPLDGSFFTSGDDFRELFDETEKLAGWHLDFGFIWLPSPVVVPALGPFEQSETGSAGQVLRLDASLFLEALAATVVERVPRGTRYVERALESPEASLRLIRPSLEETSALQEFSEAEIESAIQTLRDREAESDPELLLWRDPDLGLMRGKRPLKGEYDA